MTGPQPSIAYVTTTFPTVAWFIENEVAWLLERGFRVRVFTLRGAAAAVDPEHARLTRATRAIGAPWSPRSWLALIRWLARRPRLLVRETLRILWASRGSLYALAGHLGYLPAAARLAEIVEEEDLDRVHGAWAHFPATVAYLAARLAGRRFSMAGHAGADLFRSRAFLLEKARAADFVLTCVSGNAEMLARDAGPRARVACVHHGVDLARFDGSGIARTYEPLLLAGGRLAEEKGLDLAIRALAELARQARSARLVLFGEGPCRSELLTLARALGVADRVELTGRLSGDALLPLYRSAWMFLVPSRVLRNGRRDGIPNVLVEAMAMRLPCVGTRVAGIEEAIEPGVTGLLCPPESTEALAEAIGRLLDAPAERARMGDAARAVVEARFDARRNFERVAGLFSTPDALPGAVAAVSSTRSARPLAVLHVTEAMRTGGAESVVVELVRHAGAHVRSSVCALNGGGPALDRAQALGAQGFDLSRGNGWAVVRPALRLFRLVRLIRETRPDVVHAHNPTGALYGVIAGRLAGVRGIVRTEHSIHDPSRHSPIYQHIEPLLTAWSRRVFCVSAAVRASHASRSRRPERFVTVLNGVSDTPPRRARAETRAELGATDEHRVALCIASLTPHKGHTLLLEAFAEVAQALPARLWIAGDGPLAGLLVERARALEIEASVTFLGDRRDVADLIAASDVVTLASRREGLPMVLLEAMRAGRPVVVTGAGGSREAVEQGRTGMIVAPGDRAALAAALHHVLGDRSLCQRMGAAGRERWRARFTAERMTGQTEAIYEDVVGRSPASRHAAGWSEERASPQEGLV